MKKKLQANSRPKPKVAGAGRNGNVPPKEHRWKKGGPSPNPLGAKTFSQFKQRCKELGTPLLEKLSKRNTERAMMYIIDQAWGRAAQPLEHSGQDGDDIRLKISARKELVAKLEQMVLRDPEAAK